MSLEPARSRRTPGGTRDSPGRRDRYAADPTRPTLGEVWHDLWRRALVPGVGLFALVVGLGLLIVGPLGGLPRETGVNEWFVRQRTPILDILAGVLSTMGTTEVIIGGCLMGLGVIWWRSRQWWLAAVPGIAVVVQAAVFMLSALIVGRDRPDVDRLEDAPPTSSFPSGHTGASTAFYLCIAVLAQRIRTTWMRVLLTVACAAVPLLVAVARLYMGMHHPSDVAVGALNGAACAWLAWHYLRRTPRAAADSDVG